MRETMELIEETLGSLRSWEEDCAFFHLAQEKTTVTDSKVGGIPYVPVGGEIPFDSHQRPLALMAQLNLEELTKFLPDFPLKKGLLQFWGMTNHPFYGANRLNPTAQDTCRVLYYEEVCQHLSQEEVLEKYPHFSGDYVDIFQDKWMGEEEIEGFEEDDMFTLPSSPISDPRGFSIAVSSGKCGISSKDFRFDGAFTKAFGNLSPETPIKTYLDLDISYENMMVFEKINTLGHKMMGYPDFAKEDPRTYLHHLQEYRLLLQLDSEQIGDGEMIWGECGVATWLIHPQDLEAQDFSKVLFYWDSL